jgi:hypothetical protein
LAAMMENKQQVPQAAAVSTFDTMPRTKRVEKIDPQFPQLLDIGPWYRGVHGFAEVVE